MKLAWNEIWSVKENVDGCEHGIEWMSTQLVEKIKLICSQAKGYKCQALRSKMISNAYQLKQKRNHIHTYGSSVAPENLIQK